MRRREEGERRDRLRKEEDDRLREARWVVKGLDDRVLVMADETRFDLSPPLGRRSFKSFNPVVEELVELQLKEHKQSGVRAQKRQTKMAEQADDEASEKAISDVEMAQRLSDMKGPVKRKVV